MKLSDDTVNGLVNDLAARMNGGRLCIYDGEPPSTPKTVLAPFRQPLVEITLNNPAFDGAIAGRALVVELPPTRIAKSGQAAWARLLTLSGIALADLRLAEVGTLEEHDADIVADRLDFSRDGLCTIRLFSLRLPSSV